MAIYGKIRYRNGITSNWLQFIENQPNQKAAEAEAIRIVTAQAATI